MLYTIAKTETLPGFDPADPRWSLAGEGHIAHYHPESTAHHPVVRFRLLHDNEAVTALFHVEDQYVRSRVTEVNGPVCTDSCLEWFFQPLDIGKGYVNLEVNAGGTMLASHIRDWRRVPGGFADFNLLPPPLCDRVEIKTSLPRVVEPEVLAPMSWWSIWKVPRAFFEGVFGPLGDFSGQVWRGNFFKCADAASHPHWGSFFPIGAALNFHDPDYFGVIRFE